MLTSIQLVQQAGLQARLNAIVNIDWLKAGYPWHRAAMVEGVEAMDHWGWKWWKKQQPNIPQVQIELVDIWHFLLSHHIDQREGDIHAAAGDIRFEHRNADRVDGGFLPSMQHFVSLVAIGKFDMGSFAACCDAASLSWDELHRLYIGKNVLNIFRQANGYKEGTYVKTWDGQEDNVFLENLLVNQPGLDPEEILTHLGDNYARIQKETQ